MPFAREREENIYCNLCENQRHRFTLFVVSTDGLYVFEARALLKRLAKLPAEEWENPIQQSQVSLMLD